MRAESTTIDQLREEQRDLWLQWASAREEFHSPLVQPAVAEHVEAVRGDVEVGLLYDAEGLAALLPYRRDGKSAVSLLGCLEGVQGPVSRPGVIVTQEDLAGFAKQCGLTAVTLSSLPHDVAANASAGQTAGDYPYIDLSNGFDSYCRERKAAKSDELTTALRKTRKFERENGSLEFRWHDVDDDALTTLLRWKAEQLEQRQLVNHLAQPWVQSLFARLLHAQSTPEFAPVLSTVRYEGQLLAASFGIRSRDVLHGWVMTFNGEYYKYSPGSILLAQILQSVEAHGVRRIDMGRGSEPYKQSFRSAGFAVADLQFESRPLLRAASAFANAAKRAVLSSPLSGPARRAIQQLRWLTRPRAAKGGEGANQS